MNLTLTFEAKFYLWILFPTWIRSFLWSSKKNNIDAPTKATHRLVPLPTQFAQASLAVTIPATWQGHPLLVHIETNSMIARFAHTAKLQDTVLIDVIRYTTIHRVTSPELYIKLLLRTRFPFQIPIHPLFLLQVLLIIIPSPILLTTSLLNIKNSLLSWTPTPLLT